MSIKISTVVWGYQGNGSAKLALLALADYADDRGICWPGMEAIAKKICLSKSQAHLLPIQSFRVWYALQVLEVFDCTETHAPGMKALHCKRWGLDDQRQPFNDGHCGDSHDSWYTGTFHPVGTGAWRVWDHPVNWHDHIYFKQIPAPIVAGQLDLFL